VAEIIAQWRSRLCDISWLMRCLNEHIARLSNREDNCTGRFWEGRFKSQALLDEQALLTCMAYVDLNPIRAALAETPESSDFTSIQQRINEQVGQAVKNPAPELKPFSPKQDDALTCIAFDSADYIQLVDWSGRICRTGKRGTINNELPPILLRLGIDPEHWLKAMQPRGLMFRRAVGSVAKLRQYAQHMGNAWVQGMAQAQRLYS
jgi:hypothetical protein